MKNVFFTLAFMLVGTFTFANGGITSEIKVDKIKNLVHADGSDSSKDELLGCKSVTITTTENRSDGSSTVTTTTTVTCDTPEELARYHSAMSKLGVNK